MYGYIPHLENTSGNALSAGHPRIPFLYLFWMGQVREQEQLTFHILYAFPLVTEVQL